MIKLMRLGVKCLNIVELFVTALALSMDAFAVAVCKGLALKNVKIKDCLWIGLWFGLFQALMPTVGFFGAKLFESYVHNFAHWIAFGLLCLLGINMIKEAMEEEEKSNSDICCKEMLILAIATSIDALAVGITFAFLQTNILLAVLAIGIITFGVCVLGVKIGNKFGDKYERKAEAVGGLILIFMGIKILLEHLGILLI